MRAALVLLILVTAGIAQRQVMPVLGAAQPACALPRTLKVPGGTPLALALDPGVRLLIVATPAGLDLFDSCTGKLKARKGAGGLPSQLAVDGAAGRALVLVAPHVRLFDTHKLRWLPNLGLPDNAYPKQIAVAGGTHQALILDPGNATLWVADTRSGKVGHHVASLPGTQQAVAMDATRHRAFVASVGTNTVSVIDTTHWTVLRTTKVGLWPLAMVVSSHTGRVFVANRDGKSVSVLDAASGKLLRTVALKQKPQALAIDDKLGRVYVALQSTVKGKQGNLVVLDAATGGASKDRTAGPQGPTVTVDPNSGTVFYLDPATGTITVLPATVTSTPTPGATPKVRPTTRSTSTARPTATRARTFTRTPTVTPRPTNTYTPIPTLTPTPTYTFTPLPTLTATPTYTFTPLPTLTPTPTFTLTPTPAPTATPVIVTTGSGTLHGTWSFSFDSGAEVTSGGDVFWDQVSSTVRDMAPVGSAGLYNVGVVDFAGLSLATLDSLAYSTTPIDGNNDSTNRLVTGDVFAVHTNNGNYAKVLVTAYGYDLQLQWVTYKAPCVNKAICFSKILLTPVLIKP